MAEMDSEKPLVAVGMSGGVDSSVAAGLLVEQGYRVVGLMLRLWTEPGCEDLNRCCTPDAMRQARRVAAQLDIPFYVLDAKEAFYSHVVSHFLDGYSQGITPNPCIQCNRFVRWGYLLDEARKMGADFLATGHYARIGRTPEEEHVRLLRGKDAAKDQSYVLAGLTQEQLRHTILPLGELTKPEVRDIARNMKLVSAERPDSQDLCFLADEDYRDFLRRYGSQGMRPGEIVNRDGKVLGMHEGLAAYTIGQRKGLKIAAAEPYYVIQKDIEQNLLIVGFAEELGSREFRVHSLNWIGEKPASMPYEMQVKIRYKAPAVKALILSMEDDAIRVQSEGVLRDITAGQLAVFYQGDEVIGSGTIG